MQTYFDDVPGDVRQIALQASLNANYVVEVPSGQFVLKCRSGVDANRAIARECRLLTILAARGVRVPTLVLTRTGVPSVEDHGGAWMLTARMPGEHFAGDGRQLEAVATELVSLVQALRGVRLNVDRAQTSTDASVLGAFLDELPELLADVEAETLLRALLREHAEAIRGALDVVLAERDSIEQTIGLVHVDLHPMNVLLDGEHACILDMEDVITYTMAPALGFAGYKLVRRAVVDAGAAQGPALARRWAAAVGEDHRLLGMGARYRELALVTYILREHLAHGSFADGVEANKHLRAFAEIDWLFS